MGKSGWWEGEVLDAVGGSRGKSGGEAMKRIGWFPANYVVEEGMSTFCFWLPALHGILFRAEASKEIRCLHE